VEHGRAGAREERAVVVGEAREEVGNEEAREAEERGERDLALGREPARIDRELEEEDGGEQEEHDPDDPEERAGTALDGRLPLGRHDFRRRHWRRTRGRRRALGRGCRRDLQAALDLGESAVEILEYVLELFHEVPLEIVEGCGGVVQRKMFTCSALRFFLAERHARR
jgi:hypothetical protein